MDLNQAIQEATQTFMNGILEAFKEQFKERILAAADEMFGEAGESEPVARRTTPKAKPATKAKAKAAAPKTSKKKAAASGRLPRRSPEDIAKAVEKVASVLRKKGDLRAENIREATGFDPRELPRILKDGVAAGAFRIVSGQKRSTTYGLGKGKRSVKAKPAAKKAKVARAKKASAKKAKPAKAKAKSVAKKASGRSVRSGKKSIVKKAAPKKHISNGVAAPATAAPAE